MVKKTSKSPKIIKAVFVAAVVLIVILAFVETYSIEESKIAKECRNKNIAVIAVHGNIVTYQDSGSQGTEASSNKILDYIQQAAESDKIKAIILDIDSFGGSPVAGEEIADALKNIKKPTIALIRGAGDSAAYMAATGAQKIYASQFSEIGNIGITMSYLDYSQRNASEGIIFQQLSSGKFKDIGNPNKELTDEEKQLFMDYVQKLKESFVEIISINRNLDISKVRETADGSIMTAEEAKTKGLIDEIGNLEDVEDFLKNNLRINPKTCFVN